MRMPCSTCGIVPAVIHMPTRRAGWFCPAHCPACCPNAGQMKLGLGRQGEVTVDARVIEAETRTIMTSRRTKAARIF